MDAVNKQHSVNFIAKITTWNVNGKSPVDDLSKLIEFTEKPDFYVLSLQELNSRAEPLSDNDSLWLALITEVMTANQYEFIDSISVVGGQTAVFARFGLLKDDITNVQTASKRTYSRGPTAVRFDYKGTSIVFVGSHFHPHDHLFEERIQDYKDHNSWIIFKGNAKKIEDHDVVFWSGDFNFRLDDCTAQEIETIIASKTPETSFNEFLAKDQLRKAMKEELVFKGYTEGTPQFNPSYKYINGTNQYDLSRKPAYTDRVLYRIKSGLNGRVLSYTANTNLTISDHKPVTSVIAVE